MKTLRGRVHVYGDDINTDVIIPGKYLDYDDPEYLGRHAMEGIDPEFVKKVRKGDILVAGRNFGCGSSREQAPVALKGAGISVIIAKFYARIFYRNATNIAIPPIEADIADRVSTGDELEINFETAEIRNLTKDEVYRMKAFPERIKAIIEAGGLIPYTKQRKGI